MLLGALLGLRLRRDLVLLGYSDSLSKKNLEEVLRGEDSIVLSEVSFGGVGEA
ncbi:partial transposase in ISC1190 [Sulfolobus islandicus Y.N.15.51]|uniref:Partial transposase in ISC1190 n=3 Tax=Saccharolobus islandicus TaxID=43080 RepID=C3MZZ3_SACI3|nr:partial transposase in ISC1190 [Sulfolobus islandicus Y.N.15.51]ACP55933.1 partial transposase in ISC1190 [Sulfolobus islandicus M.16.27]ADB87896.1 transposase in ISC1190 [Sulfolobus islandicus L.D.8.5]